mmetsp:Transcript_36309/g.109783  ORF Transcript_36309/g.109783 Transcript_36309/m.109783 type:complete len:253 (-) Transcript_36309:541-1299(-)
MKVPYNDSPDTWNGTKYAIRKLASHCEPTDVDMAFSFTSMGKISLGYTQHTPPQPMPKDTMYPQRHTIKAAPMAPPWFPYTSIWTVTTAAATMKANMAAEPRSNSGLRPMRSIITIMVTVPSKLNKLMIIWATWGSMSSCATWSMLGPKLSSALMPVNCCIHCNPLAISTRLRTEGSLQSVDQGASSSSLSVVFFSSASSAAAAFGQPRSLSSDRKACSAPFSASPFRMPRVNAKRGETGKQKMPRHMMTAG